MVYSNRFFHDTVSSLLNYICSLYQLGWNLIGHSDSEGNPNTLSQLRVTDVLLVASPYELFLMEDDSFLFLHSLFNPLFFFQRRPQHNQPEKSH